VNTIRLDDWVRECAIQHVDFMWLDMQGAELTVLQTAAPVLPTVKALLIEISTQERFENNPTANDFIVFLARYNFKPVQQDIPKHGKINILFVRA
jgi:hypothetical protein